VTGVYGTGKTSVIEELAQQLEDAGHSYGAIDLDWLMWFDADLGDEEREQVFLANLAAVAGNYVHAETERLLLALAVRDQASLDAIRQVLPMPLHVVRLILPLARIETCLEDAVTIGRADDKRNAATWLSSATGVGIEDITFTNDRPVSETAQAIAEWMGWSL